MNNPKHFTNRIKLPPMEELSQKLGISITSPKVTVRTSSKQSNMANAPKPLPRAEVKIQPIADAAPNKVPFRLAVVDITPAMAVEMLKNNVENRPLNQRWVEELARQMTTGKWLPNPTPIMVSVRNYLLDGQHRLHAIVLANKTITMAVAYDVPDEAFPAIDRGHRRSPAQILGLFYGVEHSSQVNARCIAIRNIEDPSMISKVMEAPEVWAKYQQYKESIDWSLGAIPARALGGAPFAGAMAFAYQGGIIFANDFVKKVLEGENLTKKDAAYWLRKMVLETPQNSESNRRLTVIATLRAFYAHVRGEGLQILKVNTLANDSGTMNDIVRFFASYNK